MSAEQKGLYGISKGIIGHRFSSVINYFLFTKCSENVFFFSQIPMNASRIRVQMAHASILKEATSVFVQTAWNS